MTKELFKCYEKNITFFSDKNKIQISMDLSIADMSIKQLYYGFAESVIFFVSEKHLLHGEIDELVSDMLVETQRLSKLLDVSINRVCVFYSSGINKHIFYVKLKHDGNDYSNDKILKVIESSIKLTKECTVEQYLKYLRV